MTQEECVAQRGHRDLLKHRFTLWSPPERHANAFPDFGEFTQTTTLARSASKPDDWVIVVVSESLTDVLSADPKLNYREMQRCSWVLLALPTKQDSAGQQRLIRRAA